MSVTFRDCILEQPKTMENVVKNLPNEVDDLEIGREFERIYLVGSGTSLNAAKATKRSFEFYCKVYTEVISPFEFNNYLDTSFLNEKTLVIGISQSARSIATIASLKKANKYKAYSLLVTAEKERAEANVAKKILDIHNGLEPVGPKSKGYTSTIASLLYLASYLGGKKIDLSGIPSYMEEIISITEEKLDKAVMRLRNAESLVLISSGPNMATAYEGGLKILETVRLPVEVYDVEEYMHGPYHCLNAQSYMIFVIPNGYGESRMMDLINFAQNITKNILILTENKYENDRVETIELPSCDNEFFSTLGYIIPLQFIADELTKCLGRVPEESGHPNFHASLGSKIPMDI